MARSKQSGFEDLLDIAFSLPSWLSFLVALITYLIFHHLSQIEIPAVSTLEGLGGMPQKQMIKTISSLLQYLIPTAFVIGGIASFFKRRKSSRDYERISSGSSRDEITNLSWQSFEGLIAEAFRRRGFEVSERGGAQPDGGVDLVMSKDKEKFLVQCKHWRAQKVSVGTVRELYGVMSAQGAAGGFVVSSGSFTQPAKDWALGRNIELIDGKVLEEWFRQYNPDHKIEISSSRVDPGCPVCGAGMVKRTAKRGQSAGNEFWGCPEFPKCRGTRSIG